MKSISFMKSGLAGIMAAMLVMSCGTKQIEDTSVAAADTTDRNSSEGDSDWKRLCSMPVSFTSKSAITAGIQNYFFSSKNGTPSYPGEVRDLELPVNVCLKLSSTRAAFRLEYEDHYGGSYYEMAANKSSSTSTASGPVLFYSSINTSANEIDFIFLDSQGFTQIVGPKVGDYYQAKIRYANLPSRTDYIDQQIQSIVNKCKSGEWTVAKCLGYSMPSGFWWEQQQYNPSTNTLSMAREMLEGGGGAEAGTIGTVKFKLSEVLY